MRFRIRKIQLTDDEGRPLTPGTNNSTSYVDAESSAEAVRLSIRTDRALEVGELSAFGGSGSLGTARRGRAVYAVEAFPAELDD
ncbi:MAG TPA: hypothetical protein VMS56_09780 [Thermoanaerobaculia bacterium]|nr:hypothetical protein [Thermoanaerobaculia bacterium]